MTLWEIITGNSTLPIQPGNTLWDHLNNQNSGGSGYLPLPVYLQSIQADDLSQLVIIDVPETPEIRVIDYDNVVIITEEQLIGFQQ